jgi:PhoPQ-activated pathogenicity-related protein
VRKRTWCEWLVVAVLAVAVAAAVLTPVYVVKNQHDETEILVERIERQTEDRLEQSIRVNVSTISCMLLIEPADRTSSQLNACIREGLANFPEASN